jgi:hypothetical protein
MDEEENKEDKPAQVLLAVHNTVILGSAGLIYFFE